MPNATQSHCCWSMNDKYYTCASEQSQVSDNEGKFVLPESLKGYTRGVVVTQDTFIVGESGRAVREDRAKAPGLIHIYTNDFTPVKTYHYPTIGQIAEIRSLDTTDLHHWHQPILGSK